jgi:3-oxoacyl-[acyl-carrier protein] reductase
LTTRLAVVTGGNTGIGRRLVEAFAEAGHDVAFTWVAEPEAAESLTDEQAVYGWRVEGFPCDAGDAAAVRDFYAEIEGRFGTAPDVLVNNAGIQTWSSLLDLGVEDWDRVIRTNLRGCFLNTQAAARRMIAHGKPGAIVNIGSGCNKLAFPNLVDYTASKGGIEQFTKVSAVELGPHGIRVNCVAPGAIVNERTLREAPDYAQRWARITPLRRAGTVADVAGPVLYLCGPGAAFVTGQTLWVDGGLFSQANWAGD